MMRARTAVDFLIKTGWFRSRKAATQALKEMGLALVLGEGPPRKLPLHFPRSGKAPQAKAAGAKARKAKVLKPARPLVSQTKEAREASKHRAEESRAARIERRQLFIHLYGDEDYTLEQVGDLHGLTRERVRQIIGPEEIARIRLDKNERKLQRKERTCEYCKRRWVPKMGRPRFCGRPCSTAARRAATEAKGPYSWVDPKTGYEYTRDPYTGRNVRVERAYMERKLGRQLRSREWVVYKDGDRSSMDNLVVASPSEVAQDRERRHHGLRRRVNGSRPRDPNRVLPGLRRYYEEHGDFPTTTKNDVYAHTSTSATVMRQLGDYKSWQKAMGVAAQLLGLPSRRYGQEVKNAQAA
jgi:hypothetical protein